MLCESQSDLWSYVYAIDVNGPFPPEPPALGGLTLDPFVVYGGAESSLGTVTIDNAAPPGGATVALSNTDPGVVHVPSSVFIPEGRQQT